MIYLFLCIFVWSRKVDCILYLICSRSTWTREIYLDSDWVDLSDNKFGDSTGDVHRSDFFCSWFQICLSILLLASRDPPFFVFFLWRVSCILLMLFGSLSNLLPFFHRRSSFYSILFLHRCTWATYTEHRWFNFLTW